MFGECFCGAIRYEVQGPLKFVAHDHCSICRRISGAPFVTWAGVPEAQLTLLRGADSITRFKSMPWAERSFCGRCGSHLFFKSSRWPGEIHFTVASLAEPPVTAPQAHVFYSDRAPWMEIHDELPKLGGLSGTEPL